MSGLTVVVGTAFHTPTPDLLDVLADVAIGVAADGTIAAIHPTASDAGAALVARAAHVHRLAPDERLVPGMVDLHVHAPQWPQLGTALDLPLERWLLEYTFPLEARYADLGFARDVWADLVPSLLAHGTTTAVYFSSIHEPATLALAEQCLASGQRAFVGRVAMDHPTLPDWYRDDSAAAGLAASRRSIDAIRALRDDQQPIVQPIVTPRFVPACTDELLAGLGALAADTGTLVQTHCSESDWEHGAVLDRCGITDTAALHGFGLVRRGTVLAHGTHLTDDDLTIIRAADAGVAHCPLSNAYFANRIFPARHITDRGVKVGLGTDIAGGPEPSLLHQASLATTVSRILDEPIDLVRAFHMATAGGAAVLDLPVGQFTPGHQFDALAVRTRAAGDGGDEQSRFERLVHLTRPADIAAVWVAGRVVAPH